MPVSNYPARIPTKNLPLSMLVFYLEEIKILKFIYLKCLVTAGFKLIPVRGGCKSIQDFRNAGMYLSFNLPRPILIVIRTAREKTKTFMKIYKKFLKLHKLGVRSTYGNQCDNQKKEMTIFNLDPSSR
jgi:hypothetical protein